VKLRHLDDWNAGRRAAAARYAELFSKMPDVIVPFEPETSRAIFHLYVIRTRDREGLAEHLKSQGVFTGLHYPVPLHLQKCYRDWSYANGSFPVTERVASEILSLPMFPGLTGEQQKRVTDAIGAFAAV
jgi:dTDP-4-amino-4,6-dideoxygalactose transaminase